MPKKSAPNPLAPLEPLLRDPDVLEIMVDGPDRVVVERLNQLEVTNVKFGSEKALRAAMDAALALGGVKFDPGQTVADARLPDDSRVLGVLPPTAVNGPYLVLRKIIRMQPLTREKIIEFNAVSREAYALLQSAITARQNILVAGGAGSGKTTLLNILTGEIPPDERVITVEEFVELQPQHPGVVRLAADNTRSISYNDVISTAAKMRPDRLVYGELRGPETMRILDIIGWGHDGSLATLHANSPEDALARVEAMCLMANLGLGLSEIRYRIATTVNVICVIRRQPDGHRKVVNITELRGLENDRYVLQPLMRYNPENDQFELTGARPSWA